jgi:Protein of unknown function (DUF2917)
MSYAEKVRGGQMVATVHAALSRLGSGELMKIRDGEGQTLAVFDGLVWVTQDGDPRDAFIAKGETFTLDRSGTAIVEALKDTRLAVLAANLPTATMAGRHAAVADNADEYLLNDIGVALRLISERQ